LEENFLTTSKFSNSPPNILILGSYSYSRLFYYEDTTQSCLYWFLISTTTDIEKPEYDKCCRYASFHFKMLKVQGCCTSKTGLNAFVGFIHYTLDAVQCAVDM